MANGTRLLTLATTSPVRSDCSLGTKVAIITVTRLTIVTLLISCMTFWTAWIS